MKQDVPLLATTAPNGMWLRNGNCNLQESLGKGSLQKHRVSAALPGCGKAVLLADLSEHVA